MNLKKPGFISVTLALATLFSAPFAASLWMKALSAEKIYGNAAEIPAADAAVILGAAAYNTRALSDALRDRMDAGIELTKNGKVTELILTGALNETEAMVFYAKKEGVAEEKLKVDPRGTNTFASMQNLPGTYKNIIVVTQRFHLPRALFLAEHAGFRATGLAADRREYAAIFDFKKRELLASSKAVWDVLFGRGN